MLRPLLLLALLASLAPALPATPVGAAGATYQLAPWGDDRNPGTAERPWRTLHHVAQRIGQPGFPGPGDTVLVRGGTYAGAAAFPAGGLPGAPVTFAAYPGERPVFDGSQDVSGGWEHVAGTVYRRTFVRPAALPTVVGPLEPAPVSTTPDGYQSAGDRSAFLYVDDRPDTDHWLRPYSAQVIGRSAR
jgi:hypothetical protein